jgi:L,D-transpeptidase ErfK/SrfK
MRGRRGWAGGAIAALGLAARLFAEEPASGIERLVGGKSAYVVKRGDSLSLIGSRRAVDPAVLARSNGLDPRARLATGRRLHVDNRHVVPESTGDGVLVNVPQRLLFAFEGGALTAWYPVGLGRPDWPTELGDFCVISKELNPTWHVPASIQAEMRLKGEGIRTEVPPGPGNPLGGYWIGLEGSSCGIHATTSPGSVYRFWSHGCMRLHPDDAADLFSRVSIGTPVRIVYEPVLLAQSEDGSVFLEVHPDVYGRRSNPRETVDALATALGVIEALDPDRVTQVLEAREGLARRVDRQPGDGTGRIAP